VILPRERGSRGHRTNPLAPAPGRRSTTVIGRGGRVPSPGPSMRVTIRDYRPSDRGHLARILGSLQDYLVGLDPWHRVARTRDHSSKVVPHRLRAIRRNAGFILVAVADGVPVGVVVGWIRRFTAIERTEDAPTRMGFVPDLAVLPGWRGKGIGTKLLSAAERRFRQANCDQIGLGVFPPNRGARRLYRRRGYSVRGMWLVKRIGPPLSRWPAPSRRTRALRSSPTRSASSGP
jgi:ribosomal protein S18 acetylase RimI-like enzyme